MNYISAMEEMEFGAFVTCKGFDNYESIHYYKGKYYLEDGAVVPLEWLEEKEDYKVIATPDQVNTALLSNMHTYYKGYMSSYKGESFNYQVCINPQFANCTEVTDIDKNINADKQNEAIASFNNTKFNEYIKSNNQTEKEVQSSRVYETPLTEKEKIEKEEKEECKEAYNNYIKTIRNANPTKICWPKYIVGAIAFIIFCMWLSWMEVEDRGIFNENTVDMVLDNAEDKITTGNDNAYFNDVVRQCKEYIDSTASEYSDIYTSGKKAGIESLSGFDEESNQYIIVVNEYRTYTDGSVRLVQWTFKYTDSISDGTHTLQEID